MKDYRLDWLVDTVKKLVENLAEESAYPSQSEDNSLFYIELIIDPIISVFEDYKGNNCMAINLGYNYFYDPVIGNKRNKLHMEFDLRISTNLMSLLASEYKSFQYAVGFCEDSSYVEFHKQKMMRRMFGNAYIVGHIDENGNFVDAGKSILRDKYFWISSTTGKEIDSSIIYSLFPKEKVTLDTEMLKKQEEKLLQEAEKRKEEKNKLEQRIEVIKEEALSKAKKLIDEQKNIKTILLCGEGGVGKSSLAVRYLTDRFYVDIRGECIDLFIKKVDAENKEVNVFIWDIAGQERARFLAEFFANGIDGAIFCFDQTRPMSLENLELWVKLLRKNDPDLPIIFLGTKNDLVEEIMVDDKYAISFKEHYGFFDYLKVSVKSGENVKDAFNKLLEKMKSSQTLKESKVELIKKKLRVFEYLKSYKIESKEELKIYIKDEHNIKFYLEEGTLEDWDATRLFLFPEFREKVKKYINTL